MVGDLLFIFFSTYLIIYVWWFENTGARKAEYFIQFLVVSLIAGFVLSMLAQWGYNKFGILGSLIGILPFLWLTQGSYQRMYRWLKKKLAEQSG